MGSVSSINPGVADLLQTLSNVNSPVLSSPAAVSALENASPSDIVQLSVEATQLQSVDAMFGIYDGASSPSANLSDVLASIEASVPGSAASPSASSATSSAVPPADQLAGYQASWQAQETTALLGTAPAGALSDSLFNLTG
jgi:hypothetical protein